MAVLLGATKTKNIGAIAKKIDETHKMVLKAIKNMNSINFDNLGDNLIIADIKRGLNSAEDLLSGANKSLKKYK